MLCLPFGTIYWGCHPRSVVDTEAQVTRHFADLAVAGRYIGFCWR